MNRLALLGVALLSLVGAEAQPTVRAPMPPLTAPGAGGFWIDQMRFDEGMGDKKLTPFVPKTWKLLMVSHGDKANMFQAWFQGDDGSYYVLHGFDQSTQMILLPRISHLEVK